MLHIHGRKFIIGSVFAYQRNSKDFFFLLIYKNLGDNFCASKSDYQSQKRPVLLPDKSCWLTCVDIQMSSMMFQLIPNHFNWVKYTMIGRQIKIRVTSCGCYLVNDIFLWKISFTDFL